MIRNTQSMSADHAKAYFSDSLQKSDYYTADQEAPGQWGGKLAARLGLDGIVTKDAFYFLCENKNPLTGTTSLTPRTKQERTVGHDWTFICPKSVSALAALAKNNDIQRAVEDSVAVIMKEVEADAHTRVRLNGAADEDRLTGELLYSSFLHHTARPVNGAAPDPHMHVHCYIFNATWDEQEKRIKALQYKNLVRDLPYYQMRFLKRLSDHLIELGYQVKRTEQSFEVVNVPQRVIDLFSKRKNQVLAAAREKGITDIKGLNDLTIRTRARKEKDLSMAELKEDWKRQIKELGEDKEEGDKPIQFAPVKYLPELQPSHCVQHSLDHCFERISVMSERRLLERAYHYAIGDRAVTLDAITDSFLQDDRIIHVEDSGRTLCTTKEVLAEEKRMVDLARAGRGGVAPIYSQTPSIALTGEQYDAVTQILTSHNRCELLRGVAGAGKTTLMKEAVRLIEETGCKVITVAPSAQASRDVLRKEGFVNAETVAMLLSSPAIQDKLEGNVLWVDEAGMLGTRDTVALLALVESKKARLILSGDPSQHASIVRGDAVRVLQKIGGLIPAEVNKIYRQRPDDYREAVTDLSQGDIASGFERLDAMGAIIEVDPVHPYDALVADYMRTVKSGKSGLVISPTHKVGEEVTAAIREKLRQSGRIGKKEIAASRLINVNYTEAEKADWHRFSAGQIVQFNQNQRGFQRGSVWTVKAAEDGNVYLHDRNGKEAILPLAAAKHYDVFYKTEIGLSKGDVIHVTRGSFDVNNNRLNNGTTLKVLSVSSKGKVTLQNPASKVRYTLDQEFGHITHSHCITSHASQGKTVDEIFIAMPSATFPAANAKQFYVSVSRGRDAVRVYTDDKEALLEHVSLLGNRTSALELVASKDIHLEHVLQKQRSEYGMPAPAKEQEKAPSIDKRFIDLDYEPGI